MATKKTTKSTKATVKTTTKKAAPKKRAARAPAAQKVDYYPNRMTVAVAALAGSLLVLISLIAALGSQ